MRLAGQPISVNDAPRVFPSVKAGYLRNERAGGINAQCFDDAGSLLRRHGGVLGRQRVNGRGCDAQAHGVGQAPGRVVVQRANHGVVGVGEGQQAFQQPRVGLGQVNVHHPKTGCGGESAEQAAQGQQLRVVEEPDVGGQAEAVNLVGYLVQAAEVDGQIVVGELAVCALQHIVDALGDVEKAGVVGGNDHAPRVDAQGVAQGHQRVHDFGDAATVGSAVDMDDAAIAEMGDGTGKLAGDVGRQQVEVTVSVGSRILNNLNQPGSPPVNESGYSGRCSQSILVAIGDYVHRC